MTIGITFIYETGIYLLNNLVISSTIEIIPFSKILAIEILYNVIITIILYPLVQKAGHYIEDIFKERQILTRYF